MGLLDTGGFDDPGTIGLLSFGARMSNSPGGFMRNLAPSVLGALGDRGEAKSGIAKQQQEALRLQLLQQQMEEAQAKRQEQAAAQMREQQFRDFVLNNPVDTAGAQRKALELQQMKPMDFVDGMKPKADDLMAVPPGNVVLNKRTNQPVFSAPNKPEGLPDGMRMGLNGPEWIPGYLNGKKEVARSGASSVSVNTGQKGFDNTLKLRGDFRSEPIYKAHQEVQSAYSQITQSLKMASPAGDLAGATKLMKILDPGSVVRESELGMAMAASGLMDRVENYATSILKGTKLTPTQRKDFQDLATKLFQESQTQYNAKRQEYQGISERNGLNSADVLGPASTLTPGGGWSIKPVQK